MRYHIDGQEIYAHPNHIPKISMGQIKRYWHVEYPNGWSRKSAVDADGRVIYTRWIKPEEK